MMKTFKASHALSSRHLACLAPAGAAAEFPHAQTHTHARSSHQPPPCEPAHGDTPASPSDPASPPPPPPARPQPRFPGGGDGS
ncbi:unnamed protein product, partial [Coccothraustes coccothraustes]